MGEEAVDMVRVLVACDDLMAVATTVIRVELNEGEAGDSLLKRSVEHLQNVRRKNLDADEKTANYRLKEAGNILYANIVLCRSALTGSYDITKVNEALRRWVGVLDRNEARQLVRRLSGL
jgi:hypothetical protein